MEEKTKRNNKIKKLRLKGLSYYDLEKMFNLNRKTIWGIVNGYPVREKVKK